MIIGVEFFTSKYISRGGRACGTDKKCWDGEVFFLFESKSHSDAKKAN